MKHFLFLLPCEIECSAKEWFPSNGNFSLVGTQHAVHCDWVLLREYGESSCLDVLNLKVKLYFWPFRTKVNITISQWSLKLRKTNRPKYGTTRKRESKLKSCSFFGCFSQWLWLVDLENYGGYIYIYSTSGNNFLCKPKYLDWPHDLFCLVQKCTRTGV